MRNIGTLPTDNDATRFSSALFLRGVENEIESEEDGTFSIWVHDDKQLEAARALLAEYRADPNGSAFAKAPTEASRVRAKAEKEERARGSNVITRERLDYERNFQTFAWLPTVLIFACIAVAVQSDTILRERPSGYDWLRWLHIEYPFFPFHDLENLTRVRAGEVWRLVTPMLIHYGPLHLLFNMMWLRDLGTFIQNRYGALYLAALILISAALSNVSQYLVSGPVFGGMSGVNYALFGFLWIRGKCDPSVGWQLSPVIVQTMIVWFFLCFTDLLGPVANTAHSVGLAVGAGWGYVSARIAIGRRR
jgi:GlpG protein